MEWRLRGFAELTTAELYGLMRLRQEVLSKFFGAVEALWVRPGEGKK